MQTHLLGWQIKTGEPTSISTGEKGAATSDRSALEDRQCSFPSTLQGMEQQTDSQRTAGSDQPQARTLRQIDSDGQGGQACENAPDRPDPTVGIGALLSEIAGEEPIAAIFGTAAPSMAEPAAAASHDGAGMQAQNLQPNLSAQVPAAWQTEQLPVMPSGREAFGQTDAGALAVGGDPPASEPAFARMPAGAISTGETPKGAGSNAADAHTAQNATQGPFRAAQATVAAAAPKADPDGEPAVSGEKDRQQRWPAGRHDAAGRERIVYQGHTATPAGDRPTERTETPVDRQSAAANQKTAASNTSADSAPVASDRIASDQPEASPAKTPAELNLRSAEAAAPESRFSQPAGDPQSISGQAVKAEKTNPAEIMDQIVKKAVIHLREGQSEARIELKPELLGQLRLQILTENQQVTLRILAESPLVKEIIENSAVQLKADLLSQGLQMEELEVGVDDDHGRFGRRWSDADQSERGARQTDRNPSAAAGDAAQAATASTTALAGGRGIDTFA